MSSQIDIADKILNFINKIGIFVIDIMLLHISIIVSIEQDKYVDCHGYYTRLHSLTPLHHAAIDTYLSYFWDFAASSTTVYNTGHLQGQY